MDIQGLISLKNIVDDYLLQLGKDESEYLRYLRLCERSITDMHLFSFGGVKVEKITIDKTKLYSAFPKDFSKFLKLGFIDGGEIVPIAMNSRLHISRGENCGEVVDVQSLENEEVKFYNSGMDYYGEIRLNETMNRIEFSSDIAFTELYLEYVSTGLNSSEETLIPIKYREYLIADLNWKAVQYDKLVSGGEKQTAKIIRDEELMKIGQLKVNLTDLVDAHYQTKFTK